MAAEYRIHKPYVLATLPQPLDQTDGRIVAREVYGQRDGLRKRKRTELTVGVDGEIVSIYDIPASRLITSYPIPPQESFSCAPYSIRVKRAKNTEVLRYTFIATKDATSQKITLFKDVMHPDGKTVSTTTSQTLKTSPVRYLTSHTGGSQTSNVGDIWAICQNGELVSLSPDSLAIQWSASVKSTIQDVVAANIKNLEVEYVASATVSEFREGIFKNRAEVLSALPKTVGPESELLVIVSRSSSQGQETRLLSTIAVMTGSSNSDLQRLSPVEVVPLPLLEQSAASATYQIDVQSGLLMQLQDGAMSIYNLNGAVPKLKSAVRMDNATTFTRLGRPFVLACSLQSIRLYNYQYRSIHAKSALDLTDSLPGKAGPQSCQLLSYLRSQELVVALVDNVLVSIQVEPPKNQGKRRKEGLLIDSIGRGTALELPAKRLKTENSSLEFSRLVLGTVTETYLAQIQSGIQVADELLSSNELEKWEEHLRKEFRVSLHKQALTNGTTTKAKDAQEAPEWEWLQNSRTYPTVDRRWIIYAISQIFSVESTESEEPRPRIRFVLPDSNVTTYLAVAGHLTMTNIISAFRDELSGDGVDKKSLASDLIQCLTDADPSMTLLLNYLQATKLSEVELLLAIRTLMLSMDLITNTEKLNTMKLLKNEPLEGDESIEMDLDDLERELAATEHYLGDDSSSRSRGLTLAFTKLWRLPAIRTVKALRTTMKTEEILSFIYLLRIELVRGAWTSLYIDPTSFDAEGNDPPPDGVIALIADLLGRCLDAVGAGGWLFNDAMSWADKSEAGDFLTALKLEVTAALEGIEEAVYLNGIMSEFVRFGLATEKAQNALRQVNSKTPITLRANGTEQQLLPFGMKPQALPDKYKVVSGGEVVKRSAREIGMLISKKVGKYTLESIKL